MIRAAGAPVEQGAAQGGPRRAEVRGELERLRAAYAGGFGKARRRALRTAGRRLSRHLPQHFERLEGIACEAGVPPASLCLAEAHARLSGRVRREESALRLSLDLPAGLREHLVARRSRPDAGGFASVELTCVHWASAIGGVNSRGLAVLCSEDRAGEQLPLRFLVQELLLRASGLDAGLEHLRRRARYAGGSGTLALAGPAGAARLVEIEAGRVLADRALEHGPPAPRCALRLDPRRRSLAWSDRAGGLLELRVEDEEEAADG